MNNNETTTKNDQDDEGNHPQQQQQQQYQDPSKDRPPTTEQPLMDWWWLYCKSSITHCCHFHRPEHLRSTPINYIGCISMFSRRFLLECCGASGAVWGTSEIFYVRTPINSHDVWRPIAITVFGMSVIRLYWHMKHYLEREQDFPPIKVHHRRLHRLPFIQIYGTKLLLEVCGAAGAVWGSSEIFGLRAPDTVAASSSSDSNTPNTTPSNNDDGHSLINNETWRLICVGVFIVFWIRWLFLVLQYCLCFTSPWWERLQDPSSVQRKIVNWIELVGVKFVLEVLGSAGAVWGFSEVVLFRTDDTLGIWRPFAIIVGLLFLIRWFVQILSLTCGRNTVDTAVVVAGAARASSTNTDSYGTITNDIEVATTHDLSLKESTVED